MRSLLHPERSRVPAVFAAAVIGFCALTLAGADSASAARCSDDPECVPSRRQMQRAARFLSQAVVGADYTLIDHVARVGPGAWLEAQLAEPPGYLGPVVDELLETLGPAEVEPFIYPLLYRRFAWWQRIVSSPDVLRQRVALALSEIFVVSDRLDMLVDASPGTASYYDVLLRHAFGNFRDLLLDVTLHPAMGAYLSHLNNARSDPATRRFPDENYAREVMQLFSIGLYELEPDARPRLDEVGEPIPTYDNREITELAKVFTGLGPGQPDGYFGGFADFTFPMRMYEELHEPGEKRLLRDFVVPAGQSGMEDVEDAVDNLFQHPNVGPFIGRLLVQRLVTSNPGKRYMRRVSAAFADNGQGVRGDLAAVVRTILLSKGARNWKKHVRPRFGRLQEPMIRHAAMMRMFHAGAESGLLLNDGFYCDYFLGQHALSSPSVFNFFLPDHRPTGLLASRGLVAPEFQISTAATLINGANLAELMSLLDRVATSPFVAVLDECMEICPAYPDTSCTFEEENDICEDPSVPGFETLRWRLGLDAEAGLAENVDDLLDRLALVMTYDTLSDSTRALVRDVLAEIPDPRLRVSVAIYLISISPDYVVTS